MRFLSSQTLTIFQHRFCIILKLCNRSIISLDPIWKKMFTTYYRFFFSAAKSMETGDINLEISETNNDCKDKSDMAWNK